ncbi:MAG: DUF167 domain-containing protein [Brucellaceae bacterium]|nr:DUF167 domain-containing protein [Brucellaceae bacterium]
MTGPDAGPWRLVADGIEIAVRLTPKSSADRLEGVETDDAGRSHFRARVRAVPDKGAANAALCKLAAKAFGVPKGAVTLVSGSTSRLKRLHITGDAQALAQAAEALAAAD